MKLGSVITLLGLGLSGLLVVSRLPASAAGAKEAVDPHASPAGRIAAAKAGAWALAKLEPGGLAVEGVRRDEVRVVRPGEEIDEGDLVVDERGRVTVAAVRRRPKVEGEEIIVLRTRTPGGRFAPTETISKSARKGQRAWHPRLATGPKGAVWITWCGIETAERGKHRREVYLRRIAPSRPRPRQTISIGLKAEDDRHCDPVITVDGSGGPVVAWEAGTRIALRRFDAQGKARGPAAFVSEGPRGSLDRRPALLSQGESVHLAWDRYADGVDRLSRDPQYELWLRTFGAKGGSEPRRLVAGRRVAAAAALLAGEDGKLLLAYHQTIPVGLVKTLRLVEVTKEGLRGIAGDDPLGGALDSGEVQGAEFPALTTLSSGMVVAVSRPSQGFYFHRYDESGRRPILDLSRRGWGARGRRAAIVRAPDESLLVLRRARHETVLERLVIESPGKAPVFSSILERQSGEREMVLPPRAEPPEWQAGRLIFGDVHLHSAISDGTGAPDEILARTRSRGHDFAVLTDHDYVVGSRMALSEHDEISWITEVFDRLPGFTTLHGYEWTTPPVPKGFGHRNVYFRGAPPPTVFGSKGLAPTTTDLHRLLGKEKAFTAPHHTAWTGTDWEGYSPSVQRHFEIVSAHGAFEAIGTTPIAPRGDMAGMFAVDGLKAGKVFGFLGGSDGHGLLWHHGIARWADSWALGLTGVRLSPRLLAGEVERADLWDALHARHTLATSGTRMEAYLQVGELAPGEEGVSGSPVSVRILVRAMRGPVRLELVRDGEIVWKQLSQEPAALAEWSDAEAAPGKHFYYLRAIVGQSAGDAEVVWTSPIFVRVEAK